MGGRGGRGGRGLTVGLAFLLLTLGQVFGRFFAVPRGLGRNGGLACFGLLDLLKLPLLLLERLLQALLILLVMLEQGPGGEAHQRLGQRGVVREQALHAVHGLQVAALESSRDLGRIVGGEAGHEVGQKLTGEEGCGVRRQGSLQGLELGWVYHVLHPRGGHGGGRHGRFRLLLLSTGSRGGGGRGASCGGGRLGFLSPLLGLVLVSGALNFTLFGGLRPGARLGGGGSGCGGGAGVGDRRAGLGRAGGGQGRRRGRLVG